MAPGHDDNPSALPSARDLPAVGPSEEGSSGKTRFAPPREHELQVGDVLKGRFELVQELGAGGMGKVFQALDRMKVEAEDRQPHVAIKVVGRAFQRHRISFKAFQREAKRAQNLAHPNIVRVYDFDRDGPHVFITMEYLSGQSLDKIIKSRSAAEIPLEEALEVLKPVCSALAFAHANGIVHCDIKPGNIFVTDDGVVKVIDFGIARAVKRPDSEHTTFDVGMLNARNPMYGSPELGDGEEEPSEQDDVYSLACVAYELLTGRHPFGRQPAGRAAEQALPKPQGLTRKQWAGLRRALAFQRDQRTPTVQQFLADLSAPADRRRYVLAASAVAVVALGIVGALVFGGKEVEQTADLPEPPVAAVEEPAIEKPIDEPCLPQGPIDFAMLQDMQGCPADKLYQTAQRLVAEDDADTALPLVRAAAGKQHGPSALLLGEWYDPLQREEKPSPIPEPDRERALEWYRKAEAYGEKEAGERLSSLISGSGGQNPPSLIAPSQPLAPSEFAIAQAPAPKPIIEFPILPFEDAMLAAANELLDKAASVSSGSGVSSPRVLTVDPLIDGVTAVQSVATRSMRAKIFDLIQDQYSQFEVRDFTTETLSTSPLVLIGTLTALDKDGQPTGTQPDSYRIWLTLIDLQSNKIVAKARARAQLETVDVAPTPHFRDAPAWAEDRANEAYINTCHEGKVGDPIPPDYLDRVLAAALTSDAIEAYDVGRYQEALDLNLSARGLRGGDQLRVYNGIYLANRKLGRDVEASEAFGDLVDYGLRTGRLAVKFLFKPGSTVLGPNPEIPHDMWLQQIATRTVQSNVCLEISGHTSPTGPQPLNERLSLLRAEYIKQRLQQEAPALGSRMIANGAGSRENIVGIGTDDARDALDRRVEFKTALCG